MGHKPPSVSSGVSKGSLIMVLGVPVALVIVGAYAYFLLNADVEREQVLGLVGQPA